MEGGGPVRRSVQKAQARMMRVWAFMMTVNMGSDFGSISKLESTGFTYGLLVASGRRIQGMTPRVDPEQPELLLAEPKKPARRITFVGLLVCLQESITLGYAIAMTELRAPRKRCRQNSKGMASPSPGTFYH